MAGTAFDAILQNYSDANSIKIQTSRLGFAAQQAAMQNKMATYAELLDPNNPANNPTKAAAMAVLNSVHPQPVATDIPAVDVSTPQEDNGPISDVARFIKSHLDPSVAVQDAMESGPGKWAIDKLSRGMYGVGGAMDVNSLSDIPKGFWGGLTGDTHTTPGGAIRNADFGGINEAPKPVQVGVGLAADIALDPLSYINPETLIGKFNKLNDAAVALKGASKVDEAVAGAAKAASAPSISAKPAESILSSIGDSRGIGVSKAPGTDLMPFTPPRFAGTATGDVVDSKNSVELLNQVSAQQIAEGVKGAPVAPYKNLEIDPLFKNVEVPTVSKVAKTVEVPGTPVEPKVNIAPPKAPASTEKLAHLRAVKLHLMQAPDHKFQGFSVSQWLDTAAKDPKRAPEIEKLFNNEAKRIVQSKDYKSLPEIAQLRGRSGDKAGFGLNLKQSEQLLRGGAVARSVKNYGTVDPAELAKYPLHDPEDLKNTFLKNAKGQTVSLHKYLTDLGIPVAAVADDGTEKLLNKVAPKVVAPKSDFKFDFEKEPPKVPTTTKTVYEEVHGTRTSVQKLKGADALAWDIKHSSSLTPSELKYLKSARNQKEFDTIVGELRLKQVAGTVKTLDQFIAGAKAGTIPEEYVNLLLRRVGAKDLEDLKARATVIIKKTGPVAKDSHLPVTLEEDISKWTKTKGKAPDAHIWENVPSPQELVEAAGVHGPSVLMKPVPEMTPNILKDLSSALPHSIIANLVDPQDITKYPFLSGRVAAKRTSAVMREGKARNLKGWNKYSQLDMFKNLAQKAAARNSAAGLTPGAKSAFFKARPEVMYNEVMDAMRLGEAALKKHGVKFIAGDQNSGLMMSLMDVLDAMPKDLIKKHLFTFTKNVRPIKPTAFLDAGETLATAALHGGNMDLATEAAKHMFITGGATEKAAEELTKSLTDSMPAIVTTINKNYAHYSIEVGTAVTSMSTKVIDDVITKLADPNTSVGDAFGELLDAPKNIRSMATQLKAPTESVAIAKDMTNAGLLSKGLQPGDIAEAKTSARVISEGTNAAGVAQQASREAEAQTMGHLAGESVEDLGDYFDTMFNAGAFRANNPIMDKASSLSEILGKAFIPGYGHQSIHESLWAAKNTTLTYARNHRALMSQVAKIATETAGPEAQRLTQEAFKLLQQGAATTDERLAPIMDAMKHSVDVLWSGGKHGEGAFAVRNGFFPDHINEIAEHFDVPKNMRFDGSKTMADQAEVWRSWTDVKDPLDALDRMHAAYQAATVDVTVARSLSHNFGSKTLKPGFAKVSDKYGNSTVFKYMDHDLYYPKEIISQIPYYDKIREATMKNPTGNLAQFLRVFDKGQQIFKTGVTVVRPGHHLANLQGDMVLNMISGVNNPMQYAKATRILRSRSGLYHNWDGQKALMEGRGIPESIQKGGTITVGKRWKVTDDEVWRGAYSRGTMPDFHEMNDIAFNDAQKFNKLFSSTNPVAAGAKGYLKFVGKVADAEGHFTRMAQFIDVLEKSKAPTLEAAMDEAAKAVRKWHPDGTNLTPFEAKAMRRLIPFYSWLRRSTPLMIEAMALHPGRALVIPKAMNEFAQVMGMDPNSLADPFPQNALIPSWMREQIVGPQWQGDLAGIPGTGLPGHSFGMKLPGDPTVGTVATVDNPVGTFLNGLTPFVKDPIELATSHNLATGAPITDKASYLDQAIPIVSPLSNILNKTIVGGGGNQADVMKGNQAPGMDQTALLNFLTGMGVTDYSKPSIGKSAIAELRAQFKQQALNGRR